jgi:hypothetical protein
LCGAEIFNRPGTGLTSNKNNHMTSRRDFLVGCSVLGTAVAWHPAVLWAAAEPAGAGLGEAPSLATFRREVGTNFRVVPAGWAPVTFCLEAAEKLPHATVGQAERQFSLLFRGGPECALEQNTYGLEHATLGRLDVFIVPVQLRKDGVRYYEAIFNEAPQAGAVV